MAAAHTHLVVVLLRLLPCMKRIKRLTGDGGGEFDVRSLKHPSLIPQIGVDKHFKSLVSSSTSITTTISILLIVITSSIRSVTGRVQWTPCLLPAHPGAGHLGAAPLHVADHGAGQGPQLQGRYRLRQTAEVLLPDAISHRPHTRCSLSIYEGAEWCDRLGAVAGDGGGGVEALPHRW